MAGLEGWISEWVTPQAEDPEYYFLKVCVHEIDLLTLDKKS